MSLIVLGMFVAAGVYGMRRSTDATDGTTGPHQATALAPPPRATLVEPEPPKPRCPNDMVFVPAGQYFVGSDAKDALPNERPVHHVRLAAFCFDKTEVTVTDYKACSDQGRCLAAGKDVRWPGIEQYPESDIAAYNSECNANHVDERPNHPINCVDHAMARRYCESRGRRLPTEPSGSMPRGVPMAARIRGVTKCRPLDT